LVVPQPQGRHAEQRGRRAGDALVEGEPAHARVVLPEIDALLEGLLVAALLGERTAIPRRARRHGSVHRGTQTIELVERQQAGHDDVSIALEGLALRCGHPAHGDVIPGRSERRSTMTTTPPDPMIRAIAFTYTLRTRANRAATGPSSDARPRD